MIKNLQETQEMRVLFLSREDPWSRRWQPTPVSLPGESYGQRSLAGYIQSIASQSVKHDWSDLALAHTYVMELLWVLKSLMHAYNLEKRPEYNNLLLNAIVVIVSYVNLHASYCRSLCYWGALAPDQQGRECLSAILVGKIELWQIMCVMYEELFISCIVWEWTFPRVKG